MSKLNDRVIKKVNAVRTTWLIAMLVGAVPSLIYLPFWAFLVLYPVVGVVSYFLVLLGVCMHISSTMTIEELKEAEAEDAAEAGMTPEQIHDGMVKADLIDQAEVEDTGPQIGTYLDNPIYEFILVKSPGKHEVTAFYFHGQAEVKNGIHVIPTDQPGKLFTCVDGILYVANAPAPFTGDFA